jgi:putative endonuclease
VFRRPRLLLRPPRTSRGEG